MALWVKDVHVAVILCCSETIMFLDLDHGLRLAIQ